MSCCIRMLTCTVATVLFGATLVFVVVMVADSHKSAKSSTTSTTTTKPTPSRIPIAMIRAKGRSLGEEFASSEATSDDVAHEDGDHRLVRVKNDLREPFSYYFTSKTADDETLEADEELEKTSTTDNDVEKKPVPGDLDDWVQTLTKVHQPSKNWT